MLYLQIVSTLCLAAVLVDLFVDLRSARPRKKAQILEDAARAAVLGAEQRYNKASGQDKARLARQSLLDAAALQRIKLTPARADALVHQALAETKK